MAEIVGAIVGRGRFVRIRLRGEVVARTIAELDDILTRTAARRDLDVVELDFRDVVRIDTSAIGVVELARRSSRVRIDLVELAAGDAALLAAFASRALPGPVAAARLPLLDRIGDRILVIARSLGALGQLVVATVGLAASVVVRRTRLPARTIGDQVAVMGTGALGIVALLGFLVGVSIAFQGALQLRRFGAAAYVGDLVGLSMVRELAPLMTALIVTGRTGAAIAAELGTMRAGSELDALSVIGIDPVRYVVVPRVLALVIVLPVLTLVGMFVGLAGGMVVAGIVLRMSPLAYWFRLADRLDLTDFARGLSKSVVFAWIIGLAGAHLGLRARPDADGVGRATTRAVVAAVFWIIVFDAAFESIATVVSV